MVVLGRARPYLPRLRRGVTVSGLPAPDLCNSLRPAGIAIVYSGDIESFKLQKITQELSEFYIVIGNQDIGSRHGFISCY